MSSNYECKKYRNKYLLMTVFFLMFLSGWIWFNWGEITKETAGILFICVLFAMVLDCFAYNKIKSVYAEMENVSGIMTQIMEKGQEIIIDCETDISLVCDGEWLMEALINLLKNASDYSEKGKRIWVEVECTRVYTRIYIKDEGMGIAEKDIPHIFKRFYCTHREVNPNSVGIGLSLTKSIIEGMGGSIHVKSEEGQYTWFILTFVR